MFKRTMEPVLRDLARKYPIVTVTGPRQSGKTTLCRAVFKDKTYVSLETPDTRRFAIEDPRGFLNKHAEGAILDEIQRAPELLSYLQTLVDEDPRKGLFILTGSQQFEIMSQIDQSLAGRTAILKLLPLSLEELSEQPGVKNWSRMILSGFYPRIHKDHLDPAQALGDYLETYVERDLRNIVSLKNLTLFQKFVKLCAGRVGGLLNLNSLANDAGVSHTTARDWMSLLEAGYIVFLLEPYHANISKRLVKSPKLYFYDVGLASRLLGLENEGQVARDPLLGGLFENLVVIEALKYRYNRGKKSDLSFFRDSRGHEVDLLVNRGPEAFPIEIKAGATIASDYFKGLDDFAATFPKLPRRGGIVYGGAEEMARSHVSIITPCGIPRLLKNLEGPRSS